MIPLQLKVRNFMCYREDVPPLNLEGIHLACLTGANGHGKSALLDAMTWVLWGKARAKRDDELIHLGQSEMEVEFTFALGGAVYRVVRKRDSSKRGQTLLDVQVEHEGVFRSIAEPTIRATQAAIIRLLRMDYDTFTNSAFLVQGKADAFTTRTPAERKQVLGDILGLSLWDEYEQTAKERAKEKDREVAELDALLRDIDRELANQPRYETELADAKVQVAELSHAFKEADASLRALRQEQQGLEHQQARLRDLERRMAQSERDLAELEAQSAERQRRLALYEATLARRQEVAEGYAALVQAREEESGWNQRLAQAAQIQGQMRDLERTVTAARRDLELALGRLEERIGALERRASQLSQHESQLSQVRSALQALDARRQERESAQAQVQRLAEEGAALRVRNEQMLADMKAMRERIDLLQRESGAECPVCGQALTDEHRRRLVAEIEEEGRELGDAHRANTARQRELADERGRLEQTIQTLDRELLALPAQQRREAQLEQALEEAHMAAEELASVRSEWAALQERLAAHDYAPDEQAALTQRMAELEALGYDSGQHEQTRALVLSLAEFDEAYRQLQTALERTDEERAALQELQARQIRWQETLADDRNLRQTLAAEVARLDEVKAQVHTQAQEVERLQSESARARQVLGGAQQRLDHCHRLAEERVHREKSRQERSEEKAIFEELQWAFGKKGLQAMIIEAAIPEIEYEANRLLARMTDGRMNVRFETQRETLKGDLIETLDINIADELGTRAYELFSGGEAFRVNFAIRIALSKLLAHRAGAQLQMLVIDEGFGTQDIEGRDRLVEAINSIQDDFARILVITHIEELKDAFPVRIEVTKTDQGSQVRIS